MYNTIYLFSMFCVRICTLQNLVIHGAISVIHHKTIIRYCSNCMELKDKKKNKKKKNKKKRKERRKTIRNRMISAWSYVLVECFFVSEIFKHFCNMKTPPSMLCAFDNVKLVACGSKIKEKTKRNYLLFQEQNVYFSIVKIGLCPNYKKNLFYLFFICPKHRPDLMKKKKNTKLKHM